MRWIVPLVLLVSACVSSTAGEDRATGDAQPEPAGSTFPPEEATVDDAGRPVGFETRQAVVVAADGSTCEICVWLADTATQRSRGLMFVTDLGVGDAMAFRYPEPRTGTFWMKDTPLPLSIAFFAPNGDFMSSFDMEPCTTSTCPNYATPESFHVALEVPEGGLAELGIGPGSSLELLDLPCD